MLIAISIIASFFYICIPISMLDQNKGKESVIIIYSIAIGLLSASLLFLQTHYFLGWFYNSVISGQSMKLFSSHITTQFEILIILVLEFFLAAFLIGLMEIAFIVAFAKSQALTLCSQLEKFRNGDMPQPVAANPNK